MVEEWSVPYKFDTAVGAGHVPFGDFEEELEEVFSFLCQHLYGYTTPFKSDDKETALVRMLAT
jgi:hypothetical protein